MNTPYNALGNTQINSIRRQRARVLFGARASTPLEISNCQNIGCGSAFENTASENGTEYHDVRRMISNSRLSDAEEILDSVRNVSRGCEWNYLKALVLFKRGFLCEARLYTDRALEKDPFCAECKALLDMIDISAGSGDDRICVRKVIQKLIPCKKQRR